MTPEVIALVEALLGAIGKAAPGVIAALQAGSSPAEAIAAARAALPARIDPANPDPEGDAAQDARIAARVTAAAREHGPQTLSRPDARALTAALDAPSRAVLSDELSLAAIASAARKVPRYFPPPNPYDSNGEPEDGE